MDGLHVSQGPLYVLPMVYNIREAALGPPLYTPDP